MDYEFIKHLKGMKIETIKSIKEYEEAIIRHKENINSIQKEIDRKSKWIVTLDRLILQEG